MLGGEVVEREQHVEVVGDLGDRLGPLGSVVGLEGLGGLECVILVLGVEDLRERGLAPGCAGRGEDVGHIRCRTPLSGNPYP